LANRIQTYSDGNIDIPHHALCRVSGEGGWFRFLYHDGKGVLTFWGPVDEKGSQSAQFRSFHAGRVAKVKPLPQLRGDDGRV